MSLKTFALGSIEYRLPNVIESMRMLGKIGVRSDGSTGERSEFEVLADLLEQLKPFVSKIEATKDGVEISTWEEALKHMEFIAPLSEIASDLMAQFKSGSGAERKKS